MKALRNTDPLFLLYTFRDDIQIVEREQIKKGERFLSYEREWRVNVMTPSGSIRVISRHTTFNGALFSATD